MVREANPHPGRAASKRARQLGRTKLPTCDESIGCPAPLRNLTAANLRSASRLRALFDEAGQAGLLRPCAADELRFVAAAERAAALGTSIPPAFSFCNGGDALDRHRRRHQTLDRYLRPDLLIIDDMGMKQLPKCSGEARRAMTQTLR